MFYNATFENANDISFSFQLFWKKYFQNGISTILEWNILEYVFFSHHSLMKISLFNLEMIFLCIISLMTSTILVSFFLKFLIFYLSFIIVIYLLFLCIVGGHNFTFHAHKWICFFCHNYKNTSNISCFWIPLSW